MRVPGSVLAGLVLVALVTVAGSGGSARAALEGTGLPLPRFVSLRADEVKMRAGPGVQYPVDWVYRRKSLPMEVIAEFKTWRKVRDWEGTLGWVHQSLLVGSRTVMITGRMRVLRSRPDSNSAPILRAEPGVIARLAECPEDSGWCRLEIAGRDGWMRRVDFWGVYKDEAVR